MKDFPRRAGGFGGDRFLQLLITFLGKGLDSFDLTVVLQGAIVSGVAVARDSWLELWFDQLREAGVPGMAEDFSKTFSQQGIYVVDNDLVDDMATMLHLKDAYVSRPDRAFGPVLFRASLKNVAGWNLGRSAELP